MLWKHYPKQELSTEGCRGPEGGGSSWSLMGEAAERAPEKSGHGRPIIKGDPHLHLHDACLSSSECHMESEGRYSQLPKLSN